MSSRQVSSLFKNLQPPVDDGSCDHLAGSSIPAVSLVPSGDSASKVNLAHLDGLAVVFCYPRSATANEKIPAEWDAIPGARGCTPQACPFRDNAGPLRQAGIKHLFVLSTQSTDYQQEFQRRVHLPYDLLSDKDLAFAKALNLPLFEWKGSTLVKRLTLAIKDGKLIKHWYPVFPPDQNVHDILDWLKSEQP